MSRTWCLVGLLSLFLTTGPLSAQTTNPMPVQFGGNIELSVGQPASLPQVEPTIAVNPKDPKNLVVGYFGRTSAKSAHPCSIVFTTDGGATWIPAGTTPLAADVDDCFDPSLAADARGNFYYSYLDIRIDPQGNSIPDIRVARSTDGGRTFSQSSVAVMGGVAFNQPEPDKDWIAVDTWPRSRFQGTLYVSFMDITDLGQGLVQMIRVVVSRDGGRTWSSPVALSRLIPIQQVGVVEGVQDSVPVVAPNGTVFVFYMDYNKPNRRTAIKFSKSKDGGRTWSAPADAAADLPSPGFFLLDNGDPKFGSPGVGIFASSFPTVAVAPDGTISVAWTDFPHGTCFGTGGDPACVNADIRLARSQDGGATWSAPQKVSDDATTTDQFFPWIAAHPGGLLSLTWLDRRLDSSGVDYDLFYTNTPDGTSFLPNVRVTTASSKVDSTWNGGDYNNLAVTSDGIFPVWNDSRFTSVQIFTARGAFPP